MYFHHEYGCGIRHALRMPKNRTYKEKQLLRAIQKKGDAGWEQLLSHFERLIMHTVSWNDFNFTPEVQEDVRQNIHLHLRKAIPRFRGDSSLAYYIKRIAQNECINEVRRQSRLRRLVSPLVQMNADHDWEEEEGIDVDMKDASETLIEVERKESVHEALTKLHSTCIESISLFYFEHKTYAEMAERLGIARNTVGSRLHKCLDKLHEELKKMPLFKRSTE